MNDVAVINEENEGRSFLELFFFGLLAFIPISIYGELFCP